ncbi:hypothetical protein BDF21DRAFT_494660 [Thamnidium elegans]|nr:hypothetical protein BDF21DRAFT_494660 [Thamnidium elegans]
MKRAISEDEEDIDSSPLKRPKIHFERLNRPASDVPTDEGSYKENDSTDITKENQSEMESECTSSPTNSDTVLSTSNRSFDTIYSEEEEEEEEEEEDSDGSQSCQDSEGAEIGDFYVSDDSQLDNSSDEDNPGFYDFDAESFLLYLCICRIMGFNE